MKRTLVKCACCGFRMSPSVTEKERRRDARTAAVLALGEAELARVLLDLKEGEPEEYPIARRVYEAARIAAVAADAAAL